MPEDWNIEIDKITEKFIQNFGLLSELQLNYKHNPDVWSIAQNIVHLILVNNAYFQYFDEIQKGRHSLPYVNNIEQFVTESYMHCDLIQNRIG